MCRVAVGWLQRDEHRIDLAEDLGGVTLEDPAALGFVVRIEDAEALDARVLSRPAEIAACAGNSATYAKSSGLSIPGKSGSLTLSLALSAQHHHRNGVTIPT
jgi:hypothetical protein